MESAENHPLGLMTPVNEFVLAGVFVFIRNKTSAN
jgi:hypothetical protein